MQFLSPGFLWALAALSIPVIIHLFSFRRYKTIYFSNVRFLKQVKEETASRNNIKHWLVLAARLLALLFLIFAFAQPFIPRQNTNVLAGKKYVSVFVDNSYSMNTVSDGLSLFEKARQAAKEIVRNYSETDRFQLLTNDFSGRQQRLLSKDEFLAQLDAVEISPASRALEDIAKRQADILSAENGANRIAYIISDFQKGMQGFAPDTATRYNLIALQAGDQKNLYIDTCFFMEPVQLLNQPNNLLVRLKNSSAEPVEKARLSLKLNGSSKAISEFSIEPNSFAYDTIAFTNTTAGWNKAELVITDFPITFDDNYNLSFYVRDKVNVLSVSGDATNKYVDGVFAGNDKFLYRKVQATSFNADELQDKQFVILANLDDVSSGIASALTNFVSDGGALLIFPGLKSEGVSYNKLLSNLGAASFSALVEQPQEVKSINVQQSLLKDVFDQIPDNLKLPTVQKYFQVAATVANREDILNLANGTPLLARYAYGKGVVYVCATAADEKATDLVGNALFAPLLFKMAVSKTGANAASYVLGERTAVAVPNIKLSKESVYKIKGANTEFIPQQYVAGSTTMLGLGEQVKQSGFYDIIPEKGDTVLAVAALNQSRKESDLAFIVKDELEKQYWAYKNVKVVATNGAAVSATIKELDRGTPLWRYCIMLALLFLGAEVVLLRFFRT
jgi:hypothetical protein